MKKSLLEIIRCPVTGSELSLSEVVNENGEIKSAILTSDDGRHSYPVINYIPRLLADSKNYSESWGKLWGETAAILRDSYTGENFHEETLFGEYGGEENDGVGSPFGFNWPRDLSGQRVLEIGCGTGNFTELLYSTGAELLSVDMSTAVDTLAPEVVLHPNVNVVQTDINTPSILRNRFDRIWLFQVLQHTPVPADTLMTMRELLRENGSISFTSYGGDVRYNPLSYRIIKKIPPGIQWPMIALLTPGLVRLKYWLRVPFSSGSFFYRLVSRLLYVADPRDIYIQVRRGQMNDYHFSKYYFRTGDHDYLIKFVVLNTFDRITPEYTNNASHEMIEGWLADAGYSSFETWGKGGVRASAVK